MLENSCIRLVGSKFAKHSVNYSLIVESNQIEIEIFKIEFQFWKLKKWKNKQSFLNGNVMFFHEYICSLFFEKSNCGNPFNKLFRRFATAYSEAWNSIIWESIHQVFQHNIQCTLKVLLCFKKKLHDFWTTHQSFYVECTVACWGCIAYELRVNRISIEYNANTQQAANIQNKNIMYKNHKKIILYNTNNFWWFTLHFAFFWTHGF